MTQLSALSVNHSAPSSMHHSGPMTIDGHEGRIHGVVYDSHGHPIRQISPEQEQKAQTVSCTFAPIHERLSQEAKGRGFLVAFACNPSVFLECCKETL